jgi:hypothetical protein
MRVAAKTDANHREVVRALRKAGISVHSTASMGKGFPDLACGLNGVVCLLEIKDGSLPASARGLTADERAWHTNWRGHVATVNSPSEAVLEVLRHAREMGAL